MQRDHETGQVFLEGEDELDTATYGVQELTNEYGRTHAVPEDAEDLDKEGKVILATERFLVDELEEAGYEFPVPLTADKSVVVINGLKQLVTSDLENADHAKKMLEDIGETIPEPPQQT